MLSLFIRETAHPQKQGHKKPQQKRWGGPTMPTRQGLQTFAYKPPWGDRRRARGPLTAPRARYATASMAVWLLRSVLCAGATPKLHSRLEQTTVRDHPPGETPHWTGLLSNLFNDIFIYLFITWFLIALIQLLEQLLRALYIVKISWSVHTYTGSNKNYIEKIFK